MNSEEHVTDDPSCTYIPLTDKLIVAAYMRNAKSEVVLIDVDNESYTDLQLGVVQIEMEAMRRKSDEEFILIGSTLDQATAVYRVSVKTKTKHLIKASTGVDLPDNIVSKAEVISFPRIHGDKDGNSHAIYVPPRNLKFKAPADTKPPLIVWMHGGPTTQVTPGLSVETQYWTSRGYAYVSVNYGGSVGMFFDS